jgi:hypothetical protein
MSKPCIINGVELKVGDLVSSYYAGYFTIAKINYTLEKQPHVYDHWIVELDQVADAQGKPKRGKKSCDATYCRKIDMAKVEQMEQVYLKEGIDMFARLKAMVAHV